MAYKLDRVEFKGLEFEEFISEREIAQVVEKMAEKIENDFRGKNPLFIVVLNGAFVFAADLLRQISFDCKSTFVKLKSYQGLSTSGNVEKLLGLELEVKGRHVIVVEDIIDTGNTLKAFREQLLEKEVGSISLASLLFKEEAFQHDYPIEYIGFDIPNKFVIGYGLDYDDHGRNLKSIYKKID